MPKLIQLVAYRDRLLALDDEGSVYQITYDPSWALAGPTIQVLLKSPI